MNFDKAKRMLVTPMQLFGIQSGFHEVISGASFIPICRYPAGFEVGEREVGCLAKLRGETIVKVLRRVFVTK